MSTTSTIFDRISDVLEKESLAAAIEQMAVELEKEGKFHELFEARKMRLRNELGLSLLFSEDAEELDEETQFKLEEGLSKICREIGTQLMEAGRLREGWMYLRPVGGEETARSLITKAEIDDESVEEIIELALREGIAPAYGFSLVLKHYGTCNSITTFDAELSQHPLEDRKQAAGMLVEHLHQELLENVKSDIESEESQSPPENTFAELLPDREWLFDGNRYHIDTTHLASVVRFARVLTDENQLKLAADLTEYGRRLSEQYQYENEEPFATLYPSSRLYFDAILGTNVSDALAFFEEKAKSCDTYNEGYLPVEVYVELLSRVGDHQKAIDALIELMPDASPKIGIAPTLLELCSRAGNYDRFVTVCRENQDLLGYLTGLLHQKK